MNVLALQKRMSSSNVKLPNIDQIDCQFIGVFLLTDENNYTRYIDLHSKCKNIVLTFWSVSVNRPILRKLTAKIIDDNLKWKEDVFI
jgi:hypothetical protein